MLNENKCFKIFDIFIFNDNISCGIKVDESFWDNFINSKISKLFLKCEDKKYFLDYIGQEVAKGNYIRVLRVKFLAQLDNVKKQEILNNNNLCVGIYE